MVAARAVMGQPMTTRQKCEHILKILLDICYERGQVMIRTNPGADQNLSWEERVAKLYDILNAGKVMRL
jgi:hypothetical protein